MRTNDILWLVVLLVAFYSAVIVLALWGGDRKPDGPHYYFRPAEFKAAEVMCEPLGGLVGFGAVVPRSGPVLFIALCKEGKREWTKR